MMTPVVKSENPITETKKTISRESSTPRWKPSKCVITVNAATTSTIRGLATRDKSPVHRRVAGEDQEQADHHRQDEADHLVARHGRGHAADREIGAGHQQAPDVAREDHPVVRVAQLVDRDDDREGERER